MMILDARYSLQKVLQFNVIGTCQQYYLYDMCMSMTDIFIAQQAWYI